MEGIDRPGLEREASRALLRVNLAQLFKHPVSFALHYIRFFLQHPWDMVSYVLRKLVHGLRG